MWPRRRVGLIAASVRSIRTSRLRCYAAQNTAKKTPEEVTWIINYESGKLPEAYNIFGHAYTESLFTLEISIRYYIL